MAENLNTHVRRMRSLTASRKLLFDGAFGTYYAEKYNTEELPELANVNHRDRVYEIHREYVKAGADIIRTNTFASNRVALKCDMDGVRKNIEEAVMAAEAAACDKAVVAADIGPIPCETVLDNEMAENEYLEIAKIFLELGVKIFVFETFSDLEFLAGTIEYIKSQGDCFVITQFSVNQFGYSSAGLSARRLFEEASENVNIDAYGLNCGVGPGHMQQILSGLGKFMGDVITALPNAGYPNIISNRMIFANDNADYFAKKMSDISALGVSVLGGCCGTTPEYINKVSGIGFERQVSSDKTCQEKQTENKPFTNAFFNMPFSERKKNTIFEGKLIAVELTPPLNSDDMKLMESAHILKQAGVDVVTFPDSPSGRTRADSVLMAEKVLKQTGLTVMPHLCCRDKNAIAIRSQLLGAHINDINNFLVVTGDPIPSMMRAQVKSVFNFDSIGLMNIIRDMNEEQFLDSQLVYGGAINQNRFNLDKEIERIIKKMRAGASFFMTQPVFDKAGADKIKRIADETGARILVGIMPFVSLKNATFMKNEMTGIEVSDEVIGRYSADMTKEEGEMTGVAIAKEVIEMTSDFAHGYYFSFPFNRVHMLREIEQ